ncbi:MAG TPA: IclR family transcriptional regulator [Herbaspirillum sp.]
MIRKPSDENYKSSTYVVALARGLAVLGCFNAIRPELGTADIAKLTGLPQPTVWRLCNTLVEHGCLVRHANRDKLTIGLGLLGFGYAALPSLNLGELAEMEMKKLADDLSAGVSLCIPDNLEMLIIKRVRGYKGLLSGGVVGARLPIVTSASGWAYLATLPAATVDGLTEELQEQLALDPIAKLCGRDWSELRAIIAAEFLRYKEHGFVINAALYRPEINYAAVPIEVDNGVYTLHCSGLASVLPLHILETEVGPRLAEMAARLRIGLGRSGDIF